MATAVCGNRHLLFAKKTSLSGYWIHGHARLQIHMPTAYAAIKGIEVMRMIKKGHCAMLDPGVAGEVRFVNWLFYLPA